MYDNKKTLKENLVHLLNYQLGLNIKDKDIEFGTVTKLDNTDIAITSDDLIAANTEVQITKLENTKVSFKSVQYHRLSIAKLLTDRYSKRPIFPLTLTDYEVLKEWFANHLGIHSDSITVGYYPSKKVIKLTVADDNLVYRSTPVYIYTEDTTECHGGYVAGFNADIPVLDGLQPAADTHTAPPKSDPEDPQTPPAPEDPKHGKPDPEHGEESPEEEEPVLPEVPPPAPSVPKVPEDPEGEGEPAVIPPEPEAPTDLVVADVSYISGQRKGVFKYRTSPYFTSAEGDTPQPDDDIHYDAESKTWTDSTNHTMIQGSDVPVPEEHGTVSEVHGYYHDTSKNYDKAKVYTYRGVASIPYTGDTAPKGLWYGPGMVLVGYKDVKVLDNQWLNGGYKILIPTVQKHEGNASTFETDVPTESNTKKYFYYTVDLQYPDGANIRTKNISSPNYWDNPESEVSLNVSVDNTGTATWKVTGTTQCTVGDTAQAFTSTKQYYNSHHTDTDGSTVVNNESPVNYLNSQAYSDAASKEIKTNLHPVTLIATEDGKDYWGYIDGTTVAKEGLYLVNPQVGTTAEDKVYTEADDDFSDIISSVATITTDTGEVKIKSPWYHEEVHPVLADGTGENIHTVSWVNSSDSVTMETTLPKLMISDYHNEVTNRDVGDSDAVQKDDVLITKAVLYSVDDSDTVTKAKDIESPQFKITEANTSFTTLTSDYYLATVNSVAKVTWVHLKSNETITTP